jgi:plastocyanin
VSRLRLALGLAAAAAVPLGIGAACFSERAGGPDVVVAAECRVPVSVIDSRHVIVAIRDFAFRPRSIRVPVGTTVTWVNCEPEGVEPHTTTADGGLWDSPELAPGARYTRTFSEMGTFAYHCTPHDTFMKDDTVFVQ